MNEPDDLAAASEEAAERAALVFEQAGERISTALDRAARSGEVSFNRMAESILQDLARIAIQDLVVDPITNALGGLLSSAAPAGNFTLNMNLPAGAAPSAAQTRSAAQAAAAVARQVARGQRYG